MVHNLPDAKGNYPLPGPDGRTLFRVCRPPRFGFQSDLSRQSESIPILSAGNPLQRSVILPVPGFSLRRVHAIWPFEPAPPGSAENSAADGSLLLTVHALDEMLTAIKPLFSHGGNGDALKRRDFSIEKKFHFVPAVHLLITIPAENDRLVLRRIDLFDAMDLPAATIWFSSQRLSWPLSRVRR